MSIVATMNKGFDRWKRCSDTFGATLIAFDGHVLDVAIGDDLWTANQESFLATCREPLPVRPNHITKISSLASGAAGFVSGWSIAEINGIWSTGLSSRLLLLAEEKIQNQYLVLEGNPFLPASNHNEFSLWIDGREIYSEVIRAEDFPTIYQIPLPKIALGATLEIELRLKFIFSPSNFGLSGDVRELGFFVKSIGLQGIGADLRKPSASEEILEASAKAPGFQKHKIKKLEISEILASSTALDLEQASRSREDPLTILNKNSVELTSLQGSGGTGFLAGWSHVEEDGIWSIGNRSRLSILIQDGGEDQFLAIYGRAFLATLESNNLSISVNGKIVSSFDLVHEDQQILKIPLSKVSSVSPLMIEFQLEKTFSPRSLGLSEDARELGFFVQGIGLYSANANPVPLRLIDDTVNILPKKSKLSNLVRKTRIWRNQI